MHGCIFHIHWIVRIGILSLVTWFGLVRVSHSCQTLSVDGACLSLATFVVPTPVKTIIELFRPAFGVLPKTGDAEPVDRGKSGWERLRTICARSISAWLQQGGALWIDRYGVNSWRRRIAWVIGARGGLQFCRPFPLKVGRCLIDSYAYIGALKVTECSQQQWCW